MKSKDGITKTQAKKFAKRFNLTDLRLVDGYWIADDCDEPYTISYHNYTTAIAEGDLKP